MHKYTFVNVLRIITIRIWWPRYPFLLWIYTLFRICYPSSFLLHLAIRISISRRWWTWHIITDKMWFGRLNYTTPHLIHINGKGMNISNPYFGKSITLPYMCFGDVIRLQRVVYKDDQRCVYANHTLFQISRKNIIKTGCLYASRVIFKTIENSFAMRIIQNIASALSGNSCIYRERPVVVNLWMLPNEISRASHVCRMYIAIRFACLTIIYAHT